MVGKCDTLQTFMRNTIARSDVLTQESLIMMKLLAKSGRETEGGESKEMNEES